jgi:hypothetical protein
MAKEARRRKAKHGVLVRGFYRVNIVEQDGRIVGDSGWLENTVVDLGRRDYLCHALAANAGSKQIALMALGTGTAPAAADTAIAGELTHRTGANSTQNRQAVTTALISSSQIEFRATFSSNMPFITTAVTIQNIAILNSTHSGGTIFAGSTYPTSALNTNQDVQASYRINFT